MSTKADLYRKRAKDFEEKARLTFDHLTKAAYLELAAAYRELATHTSGRSFQTGRIDPRDGA